MSKVLFLLSLLSLACATHVTWTTPKPSQKPNLVTEFEWKYFDYDWLSPHMKDYYIKQGLYNPKAILSIDVDRSADGRTFLTTIRDTGVPASVNTISSKRGKSGPLLTPYPDWSWYGGVKSCNRHRIVSAFRVAIDTCNRLWVLDTGYIGLTYTCPAQLLAFDLENDQLVYETVIPPDVAPNSGEINLLTTPVVQIGETCEQITVYIADNKHSALLVWDSVSGNTKRIKGRVFGPEKKYTNITVDGAHFSSNDGILGMALTPPEHSNENPELYFTSLASRSIRAINTQDLYEYNGNGTLKLSKNGIDYLPSQAIAIAFSSKGTLFYSLTKEIGIGCWNLEEPFEAKYFKTALQDKNRLQWTSGLKVIECQRDECDSSSSHTPGESKEYLLMTSNRFQKYMTGTQNLNETNFRVLSIQIEDIQSCPQ
ncbi:hypothetical protein QAD02_023963 [Eretmocerus hayati]|uniref:Uncharacterized protein n=1 Tax=Eretmocerus hayati TaxID=131215 RepID=A0ACC2PYZ4_9HYME|nr:hypothetical protein QAD02_023963 [Eretmocerus hayati]